ncbi:hypothetical protein GOP47_0011457 [Adiantum capillus-veneris]|uniref:ABM domain-containing protein n=1 Tax=Adiantum capillus-veneris TaxID=13818 RepID=A0A9D4USU0_ADICA|nr:hypothetical protein GOP47_0011457 [Adiantum capillus-veneris]
MGLEAADEKPEEAFSVMEPSREDMRFYMVVFRSKRREGADSKALYAADAEAHEEAKRSGGLLMYWYGSLNERRECFATCIWKSREDALRATKLPKHIEAAMLASQMYEFYRLEKYWLTFSIDGEPRFEDVNGIIAHI